MNKKIYFYTNLLAWGLVLLIIGNYVFGWTTPSATPPSSNLPAPINVSSTEQTKAGNLIIGGTLGLGLFATAPSGTEGALYYNTTQKRVEVYIPGAWLVVSAKLALSEECTLDGDCDSTHCVDGYCCNTACGGTCDRCNVADSIGTCINVDSDCTGNCDVCSGGDCAADASLCTGNCDVCSGSGTAYSCAASNDLCSTSTCTCTGSGTVFNCSKPEIGTSCQGGKVAYVDGTGMHGLIAALSDQSTGATWGCYGTAISGADGTAIGTGLQNTIDIMNGCAESGIAARLCRGVSINGYDDWYLPSTDELYEVYRNRDALGLSGFSGGIWSSSEYTGNQAKYLDFYTGNTYNYDKDLNRYVRAMRSF